MRPNEGKLVLQDAMDELKIDEKLEYSIKYVTGKRDDAKHYSNDTIIHSLDPTKLESGIRFIVKCYYKIGVFVAWTKEFGDGTKEYITYKKDLVEMQESVNGDYMEINADGKGKVCYFKGRSGAMEFFKRHFCSCLIVA